MKEARLEPYFGLWKGHTAHYSELGETAFLVDIFVAEQKAVRQYDIFGDSLVWMPKKITELMEYKQQRILALQAQLNKSIVV